MKTVILDAHTANPGDLNWDELHEISSLKVLERTENTNEAILKAIGDAEAVLTNKTELTRQVLNKTSNLKYIGILATGYNVVDLVAAREFGITVTNVPSYSASSVAQFVFALLLEICHQVGAHSADAKSGGWTQSKDFSYWNSPLIELEGKTMGIIGFGSIGQATAKLAKAFGMRVMFNNRSAKPHLETKNCMQVSMEELLAKSDVVSLHAALTEETKYLINALTLKQMKKSSILINTSRGGLINEADLADALLSHQLYAAAVDVVSIEPIETTNPLLNVANCVITPHIAWATKESRQRLIKIATENLKAYISKHPVNVVS